MIKVFIKWLDKILFQECSQIEKVLAGGSQCAGVGNRPSKVAMLAELLEHKYIYFVYCDTKLFLTLMTFV